MSQLFKLGQVVATPGAATVLEATNNTMIFMELLTRHVGGDFGNLGEEDHQTNLYAIQYGGRVMSVYSIGDDTVWLITEADRSVTTFLLPSEY